MSTNGWLMVDECLIDGESMVDNVKVLTTVSNGSIYICIYIFTLDNYWSVLLVVIVNG